MVELAVVVMTGQIGDAGQLTQVRWSKIVQHAKRRDSHIEIDTFWQAQPVQCCKGVRDVVITTQSINQTSRGVKNRLEVPLLISRKPDQGKIAIVESCVHKLHHQRKEAIVSDVSTMIAPALKFLVALIFCNRDKN